MSIFRSTCVNKGLNCFQKYRIPYRTTLLNFSYNLPNSLLYHQINLFQNKREIISYHLTDKTRFQASKFSPGLKQGSIKNGINPGAISYEASKAIKKGLDIIIKKHDNFKEPIPFYIPIIDELLSPHSQKKSQHILIIVPFHRVAEELLEKICALTETANYISVFAVNEGQDYSLNQKNIIISTSRNSFGVFGHNKIPWSDLSTIILYDLDSMLNPKRYEEINHIASCVKDNFSSGGVSVNSKPEKSTQLILVSDVIPHWLQSIYVNFFNKKNMYIEHPASRFLDLTLSSDHFAITTLDNQVSNSILRLIERYCTKSSRVLILCKSLALCQQLKDEIDKATTVRTIVFQSQLSQDEKTSFLKCFDSDLPSCIFIREDSIGLLELKNFDLVVQTSIANSDALFYERFKKLSELKIATLVTLLNPELIRVFEELVEKISMTIRICNVPCPYRESFLSDLNCNSALSEKVYSRSLIDGKEGYTTLLIQELKRSLVLCDLVYNKFKLDPLEINLRQISQTKDRGSLVFDAQTSSVPKILKAQSNSSEPSYTIRVLEELPPLLRGRDELKLNYRANKNLAKSTSVLVNRYINKSGNREFDREATDDFTTWGARTDNFKRISKKTKGQRRF